VIARSESLTDEVVAQAFKPASGGARKAALKGCATFVLCVPLLTITAVSEAAGGDLRVIDAVRNGDRQAVRTLLQQNVDVNARQPDGATALAWAVHREDAETVALLIARGSDVDAANDYGVTPLWLACVNRNAALVGALLNAGANPNAALWTGETVLMTCAGSGVAEGVEALIGRGAAVNHAEPRRRQTALMWAAAGRHPDVVRTLLAHGADVRARSQARTGHQPMVFASWGGDVPATSAGGFSALLFAAQQGDVESARLLMAAGADVNEASPGGMTPLLMAAASGHGEAAIFFLERGGDPNAPDESGATALHYALRDGMKIIHELIEKPDVQEIHTKDPKLTARLSQLVLVSSTKKPPSPIMPGPNMPELVGALLARGADPNARLAEIPPLLRLQRRPQISLLGATPFVLAAATADVGAMRALVAKGADPTIPTRVDERQLSEGGYSDDAQIQGNATPLHAAAGLGRADDFSDEEEARAREAVALALALGNDVNATTATGWTALHAAVFTGADSIVELLVKNGARIDARNGCGQTPLSLARGDNVKGLLKRTKIRESTVELLVRLGASAEPAGEPVGRCVEGRWGI
jgi:ankyrin repeat protein